MGGDAVRGGLAAPPVHAFLTAYLEDAEGGIAADRATTDMLAAATRGPVIELLDLSDPSRLPLTRPDGP